MRRGSIPEMTVRFRSSRPTHPAYLLLYYILRCDARLKVLIVVASSPQKSLQPAISYIQTVLPPFVLG
jgi:hypothetical protein